MKGITPPVAPMRPHTTTMHGEARIDDYFWLRDRDDPAVLAYLEGENQYLEQVMAHTAELQQELYTELRARIKEDDLSAPERYGAFWYTTRTTAGRQYPIYCRAPLDNPDAIEVILDQNALAEGHDFCKLGCFKISPDGSMLAYSVDTSGAESFDLYVKDLATGALLLDHIPNSYYSVEWANDNRTLFYNTLDPAMRPFRLYRHTLGNDPTSDLLVYEEPDESYFLELRKTRSRGYLLLNLGSTLTREVRLLNADTPQGTFEVVRVRHHGHEYGVEHQGDQFLIWTNDEAPNFRLMAAPLSAPGDWHELVPHRADTLLERATAFRNHLVLLERRAGLQQLRISDPDGVSNVRAVTFPEPVYTFWLGRNFEYDSQTLRLNYSSLVTPDSVVDYDMTNDVWMVVKQQEIPSGYDPALYTTERLTATAPDGAQVPISLVYRRDLRRADGNPLLLYGYGSYGASMDPGFVANRLSLLDRGITFAIGHIRGGSELGRTWYDQGKMLNKRNTFTDFIACAEHLIATGYTTSEQLAIMGRSAGGLLVGAVVTLRPELFKAAIAGVPFVDVINTMSDPSIPLTSNEWEQWGNPADAEQYAYMLSYSPYDNVARTRYPNLLATAGLNDPRVAYWEPAKWVAKLRQQKTDENLLLLKTNFGAGHSGASGRYDYLKEVAFEYAFLVDVLGLE